MLTNRQTQIIKCIVEEYQETAEPVGSDTLDKKFNLGISPATIRNEMSALTRKGFLIQPHTSAGRIPTPTAIKFYIQQLMKEKELSVAEEVDVKEKVWDSRDELGLLLRQATKVLSERTGMLALASTDDSRIYHSGYARILDLPEFFDINLTRQVLLLLEEAQRLQNILNRAQGDDPIHVLLGDEVGEEFFQPLSIVFSDFTYGSKHGRLGVIGPSRLNYSHIIPMIRYISRLISQL